VRAAGAVGSRRPGEPALHQGLQCLHARARARGLSAEEWICVYPEEWWGRYPDASMGSLGPSWSCRPSGNVKLFDQYLFCLFFISCYYNWCKLSPWRSWTCTCFLGLWLLTRPKDKDTNMVSEAGRCPRA